MAPSTQWAEISDPGEAARLEKYAETLHAIQRKNAGPGPAGRALHHKGQLGLRAEFTVLSGLPDYAQVGLFAHPAVYRTYARFSNGAGASGDDRKGDARGLALKLLGVGGKKIIPGLEQAPTQDFLFIRDPALPFKNADEFVPFITNIGSPLTGLPKLFLKLGFGRTLQILKTASKGLKRPMVSLATTRYYSASPIQFGSYAAHYALKPRAVDGPGAQPGTTPDYLAEDFSARLGKENVVYDFGVQFFVDEAQTPIEDASVEWREEVSPFLPLARLAFAPQDPASPPGRKLHEFIEKLSFDPWHAQEEFRPLGNIMRARRVAYKASAKERQALPEPDGSEKFD
jgi:hypothetical protein